MSVNLSLVSPSHQGGHRETAVMLTDLDFADFISLLLVEVDRGKELLKRVEKKCAKVGHALNVRKTGVTTLSVAYHELLTISEVYSATEVSDVFKAARNY